jgi:hypothetical protein
MSQQRWKFGAYPFTYNPKEDSRSIESTADESVSINGMVTSRNNYYVQSLNLTIDLYDKPSYYAPASFKTFTPNQYVSIAEKRSTGYLYCLRNGAVDVINKTGGLVQTITHAFGGTPLCIAHLDNKLAILIKISASLGYLYITDESAVQISKYTITDADYLNVNSMSWDFGNILYLLNGYGKIFQVDYTTGQSSLIKQYNDYASNLTSGTVSYTCMHRYNGYNGYIRKGILTYVDYNQDGVAGTEVPLKYGVGTIVGLAYGDFTTDFTALSSTVMIKFNPNVCAIDIERIKKEVVNGIVPITDDKNYTFYAVINEIGVTHKRNKQEQRFEVSLRGTIL